jgi:hypothetical protein
MERVNSISALTGLFVVVPERPEFSLSWMLEFGLRSVGEIRLKRPRTDTAGVGDDPEQPG